MKIALRKEFTTSLLVPTSMGIRITPFNGQPVHCSNLFSMQATSAESNVASVSSYLGLPVKILTTFVKGSPMARFIKDDLAQPPHRLRGQGSRAGRPLGLPPPDQHRRQRRRLARPAGLERPRRRSRPHAERQRFRPGPHLRQGRRADRPPLRPDRGAVARDAASSAWRWRAPPKSMTPASPST